MAFLLSAFLFHPTISPVCAHEALIKHKQRYKVINPIENKLCIENLSGIQRLPLIFLSFYNWISMEIVVYDTRTVIRLNIFSTFYERESFKHLRLPCRVLSGMSNSSVAIAFIFTTKPFENHHIMV